MFYFLFGSSATKVLFIMVINEDHRAIIKFALHSIKGQVNLDFQCLAREKFLSQWVLTGFCSLRGDVLSFHF